MATTMGKKPAGNASAETKADKRRLAYLKERTQELRNEMKAVRKEAVELRAKLGMRSKAESQKAGASE